MEASKRLSLFAAVILLLNVVATVVAILANWPSQFGAVRTDAGDDFLTAGTAISAPVLPVVLLVMVALLARRHGAPGWIAVGAALTTAVLFFIGAMGELAAEPTVDTPKAILVGAGIAWTLVAMILALLAVMAAGERLRERRGDRSATP